MDVGRKKEGRRVACIGERTGDRFDISGHGIEDLGSGWFARRPTSVVICKNRRPIAISELGRCLPISVQQPSGEWIDGEARERERESERERERERERGQWRCTTGVG